MKEIGLTMAETGIIWGVMPFAGAIIRVGIGAFADKLQRHKSVLIFCSIASGVVHCFLLFVPHAPVSVLSVQVHCDVSGAYIESCPQRTTSDSPFSYSNRTYPALNKELDVLHSQLMFNASDCFFQCTSGSKVHVCLQQTEVRQDMVHPGCVLLGDKSEGEYDTDNLDLEVKQFVYYVSESNSTGVESHRLYLSSYVANDSTYASMTCQKPSQLICKGKCLTITDTLSCGSQKVDTHDTSFGRTFWIFSMIFFVGQVAFAPIFSLIDAITYDFLGAERHKWGKQRLWGTIGHGGFALSSGFLVDLFSRGEVKTDFTVAFVIFAIAEFLSAGMTSFYRVSDAVRCSRPSFKDIPMLLKRPDVLLLLIIVVVFGMYTGLIETFLFIHLDTLGQPPLTLFGLSMVANCVPQMIMFFFSGTVIEKLGHVNCVCLACAAFAVRMSAYSILRSPWMVLLVEPLHAITFGLFYATVSSYGSLITPKGLHGTIQGIIGSLYFGIGKLCLNTSLFDISGVIFNCIKRHPAYDLPINCLSTKVNTYIK